MHKNQKIKGMSKKNFLFIMLFAGWIASGNSMLSKVYAQTSSANSPYRLELISAPQSHSKNADTLFFIFRIIDHATNKKVFVKDIEKGKINIEESGNNPPRVGLLENLSDNAINPNERISQDAIFWIMIDRSNTISPSDMLHMKETIQKTVESLPEQSVYISFFDKTITDNRLITKGNFDLFAESFAVQNSAKNLYEAIVQKFAGLSSHPSDATKYLLIFTDGKINANSVEEVDQVFKFPEQIQSIDNANNKVQIHAFRYGRENQLVDMTLTNVCSQHRRPEAKGGFYPTENVSSVIDSIKSFIYDLSADYKLTLINPPNKIYNGQRLTLQVVVETDEHTMAGEKVYFIASKENPIKTGDSDDIMLAIVLGLLFIFITFFIIQVVIPYFRFKFTDFEKKYVVSYQPEGDIYEECFFCSIPFEKDDRVVVKCCHKTHWDCWEEAGHKCVEYGQHCKEGVQFYFDKNRPFDLSQSPYFLKWAMSGMFGGFLIWILYKLCLYWNPDIFQGFTSQLLQIFYPDRLKEVVDNVALISSNIEAAFQDKIRGFLLVGLLLGFVLSFLFMWINDYRQKKFNVVLYIIYRGLLGGLAGGLSFLIGAVLCIALGKGESFIWIDWMPWLMFGASTALCLSLAAKATIKWQDALIGGIISGLISFLALFLTSVLPSFGVMLGFMLCSTGLGISIVAKHQAATKYFLKFKSDRKEGEIAIHKWMDESGGSNEVSIGKSNHCIIQMNWDNSEKIADTHVKLYIDKKRKVPVLKVLETDMTYDGRTAHRDDVNYLTNGIKFKIGNTDFQYAEK